MTHLINCYDDYNNDPGFKKKLFNKLNKKCHNNPDNLGPHEN